jgi:Zn ribbon nucleic-acid-binding protein
MICKKCNGNNLKRLLGDEVSAFVKCSDCGYHMLLIVDTQEEIKDQEGE